MVTNEIKYTFDEESIEGRDLAKLYGKLSEPGGPLMANLEREQALINVGHACFSGSRESAGHAVKFLPLLLQYIKKESSPYQFKLAALKSLCEMSYGNKTVKEFIVHDRVAVDALTKIINSTETFPEVRLGRWGCYLIVLLFIGSPHIMMAGKYNEELKEALVKAADFPRPWPGWGMNMADLILKILHHRDPSEPVHYDTIAHHAA